MSTTLAITKGIEKISSFELVKKTQDQLWSFLVMKDYDFYSFHNHAYPILNYNIRDSTRDGQSNLILTDKKYFRWLILISLLSLSCSHSHEIIIKLSLYFHFPRTKDNFLNSKLWQEKKCKRIKETCHIHLPKLKSNCILIVGLHCDDFKPRPA